MRNDALHSSSASSRPSEPVRTCVGCRSREQAAGLLRVVAVEGTLVPDPRRRLPGRGAWLHPVPECLDRAERRSAFARALRVRVAPDTARIRSYLSVHGEAQQEGIGTVPFSSSTEDKVDPS